MHALEYKRFGLVSTYNDHFKQDYGKDYEILNDYRG